jgi:signal transduction histidine kinase
LVSEPTPLPTLYFTVRALAVDANGKPWVGNWEGITRYDGSSGFTRFGGADTPFQHVSALLFDRRGRLWVGTSDNGLFLFASGVPAGPPDAHLMASQEITTLQEDAAGNPWAGGARGTAVVPAGSTEAKAIPALQGKAVSGLSLDVRGRVWACTLGGELWMLTPGSARGIDARAGLPPHPLYRALDDGAGSLWISSPRGLLRVAVAQVERALGSPSARVDIERYGLDDGMRTIECHRMSQPAGGRDAAGNLWFPTSRGFVRVHPGGGERDLRPPAVRIESASLRLEPGEHNLEIPFTAMEFRSPEKVEFRYRMDGFDPFWVDAGGTHTARYSGLPPGRYRFLVSARMPGGEWSEPQSLPVTQLPKFYQTGWFALLVLLSGVAVAILIVRWRVHTVRARYAAVIAERNRIGREWHDTLVAGFSAISLQLDAALQRVGEPSGPVRDILEVTRKMVHHYRAEARRVIWDLRDNRPEAERLVDAIESAVRLATDGKEIRAHVKVSGEVLEASRDVEHNVLRICQEALNNAVRHGQPHVVDVRLDYTPSELRVRIADDGKGFRPAETARVNSGHFGVTVMQERARRFGGTFRLSSEPGRGTVVEAAVPLAERNNGS